MMADAGRSRLVRTMADGGGGAGRCLSDLSDDLLRHIIFLASDKEGAATAVLSRRWRWLWRTSGAVYLDSRYLNGSASDLRGAEEALTVAAAHGPVRRITLFIPEANKLNLLIAAVVKNPAARRVEELRIKGSMTSETLRVLHITNCSTLTAAALPPGAAVFPMLVDLHLQDCSVPLVDLQSIIDASPRLSALHLTSTHMLTETKFTEGLPVEQLLIPTVSALVLVDSRCGPCHPYSFISVRLEMEVPMLQYFRYRGHIEDTNDRFVQGSGNMVNVDLHLTHDRRVRPTPPTHELFWRFIQTFNSTKLLKLRIDYFTMDDLAPVDKARRVELLGGLSFSLLEQLEVEIEYKQGQTSMVMLADLLHCCPMVRDLRINLMNHERTWFQSSIDDEDGVYFDMSVSGFRNRRRKSTVSLDEKNDDNYETFDIPDLTGQHSFSCLQSHLKRVSLQFCTDEPNCLGIQLAKFFAKNAMVLQEMHIDDGSKELLEHVNFSVPRWVANTHNGNSNLNVKE